MTQPRLQRRDYAQCTAGCCAGWLIPSPDDRAAVVFFWCVFLVWLFGAVYERTERDELR